MACLVMRAREDYFVVRRSWFWLVACMRRLATSVARMMVLSGEAKTLDRSMSFILPRNPYCSFCENISNRFPWHPIVEWEHAVAFVNVRQRSHGSMLVATRRHVGTFTELLPAE